MHFPTSVFTAFWGDLGFWSAWKIACFFDAHDDNMVWVEKADTFNGLQVTEIPTD